MPPPPAAPSRKWPTNTPTNLYLAPAASIIADYESERERLFVPDDEVNISIIELCPPTTTTTTTCDETTAPQQRQPQKRSDFENTDGVLEYVREREGKNTNGLTTILIINQTFSWGELEISSSAIQSLFTHFDISPGFWPVVKLFGCKESDDHEAAGGFNELVTSDKDISFEISYTAKHAEEHNRPERAQYDPWSIRQIGVNHRYDAKTKSNIFILVNPSNALMKRIEVLAPETEMLDVHRLIVCAVTERWGQYLAHLESVCKDISKKAVLAKGPRKTDNRGFDVHFSDSQRIRDLQDTVIHVSHMLDLNLSILEKLSTFTSLFTAIKPTQNGGTEGKAAQSSILTLSTQTRLWKCHAENLLRRLDGSSVLVRSILDAKALETLQASSHTTAELAALAREDAIKAKKDARTLNTITILGFVYLPASFVATLLGTQYINIRENDGGNISITFARELFIFAILTVILLVFTTGTWLLWEWRNRLADRAEDEKSGRMV